jgi:hypothetical protein
MLTNADNGRSPAADEKWHAAGGEPASGAGYRDEVIMRRNLRV